ncbi:hypothetical protein HLB23_28250 [Nocardia uniformis]|uniref:Uncharacterized protein n=1 Tax=Nocardia uniformis TaxID=53432 RepID=A0A849CED8_9NOCA|nr:hypothetical protein [Nocardia uniformis]NNH73699.1 hypothetical protein [Nocardia uniformis]
MRFFDVIFATRHFDAEDTIALWRKQECGDLGYVTETAGLHADYCRRLKAEAGDGLGALLGFNITTSIGAMLPDLPRTFLATTCEFPAVLSQFQRSGCDLAAWLCPFTHEIRWRSPAAGHVVLLVSHVDYITGQDIVDDVIDVLADSAQAQELRFTVIVDGAHGIGNNSTIADVAKMRASFSERLDIEDFVYIFDHNKWLLGFPGMSVSLHTGVRAPAIEGIFPTPASQSFAEFGEPVSVSFNPLLPQWAANLMGPAERAFDTDSLEANRMLSGTFRELTTGRTFPGVDIFHANSNMALLSSPDPRVLLSHLGERGCRTHLMGSSKVRGSAPGATGGVRLTFSSLSLQQEDIHTLIDALEDFRP